MRNKLTFTLVALALASILSTPLMASDDAAPVHGSVVFDLLEFSRISLPSELFCDQRDGGGPTLDQILLDDVDNGGGASIPIVIGLEQMGQSSYLLRPMQACGFSTPDFLASCGAFKVSVALIPPSLPTGEIVLETGPRGLGGIFRGEVRLPLEVTIEDTETGAVETVVHDVTYYLRGPWARQAGPGALQSTAPFAIDTNCDGINDGIAPASLETVALGWVAVPDGEATRGVICGAGEELGGWLCASPASVDLDAGNPPGMD